MDVNSNNYTFMFAAGMVLVVAAILSLAATSLKPFQDTNIEQEKMQNILSSIGVDVTRAEAPEAYGTYIKQALVINNNQSIDGIDAFTIDMEKEIKTYPEERNAPLYIAEKDGETYFILPLQGKGLWGPVWGYISLKDDMNTVFGATFDHKTETPGLGAEITTAIFTDQFPGKKILDAQGSLVSIEVRKGDASGDYQVDGISGGTITSNGVQDMIKDCLQSYLTFLKSYQVNTATASIN